MEGLTPVPIALTIAGSDSSGGAGIQADLKTFTALSIYGASVITAITAQNTLGVTAVHAIPQDMIRAQARAVASDLTLSAAKTGMLGDSATVETVAVLLMELGIPMVVIDPVMIATSGDVLLAPDAIDAVIKRLLPLADLLTPNLHEAARLTGQPQATSLDAMAAQGRLLLGMGARNVLVKGGHFEAGNVSIDVLVTKDTALRLSGPRIATRNTHGTGCTLSAAITAELARGAPLEEAAASAKAFISKAIASGATLAIGHGAGPVDHLFARR